MFILDSHCDAPSQMVRGRDFTIDNEVAQVDFPKMMKGGVSASFFALYTSAELSPSQANAKAWKMLEEVKRQVGLSGGKLAMAYSSKEVEKNYCNGLISILIGMENGSPLMGSFEEFRKFYDAGVRYITLAHNGDNEICDSCAGNGKWGGLSPFGKELVAEMNRKGVLVDVAHCADSTVRDCLSVSSKPIVTTHSCCKALCSHRRNLPDDLMKAMADKGGVMQINFYPHFLSDEFASRFASSGIEDRAIEAEENYCNNWTDPVAVKKWEDMQKEIERFARPSCAVLADHIDYAVNLMGIDHVGIGSDFDGINVTPEGMENISFMGRIFDELSSRGYSSSQIEKIAGQNFLSVMKEAGI